MTAALPEFAPHALVLVETPTARTRATVDSVHGDRISVVDVDDSFASATPPGTAVTVLHITHGGVYTMRATLTELQAGAATLLIDDDVDRVQRRRYVRIDRPLPAHVLILDDDTGQFQAVEARVTDVSGGGLAMRAGAIAPQGAVVVVALSVPDERPVVAVGSALANDREDRAKLGPDGSKLRIQFTHLTEADRDRLIRHILRTATASES